MELWETPVCTKTQDTVFQVSMQSAAVLEQTLIAPSTVGELDRARSL